jgi:hypothetical protein
VIIKILRESGVSIQTADKPYHVRFKEHTTGKELQGMTHNKGTTVSPRFLLQILERFDITIHDFLDALATAKKGPQRI